MSGTRNRTTDLGWLKTLDISLCKVFNVHENKNPVVLMVMDFLTSTDMTLGDILRYLKQIHEEAVDHCTSLIEDAWSDGNHLPYPSYLNEEKVICRGQMGILAFIHVKLAEKQQSRRDERKVYKSISDLLMSFIPIAKRFPAHKKDLAKAGLHFEVKELLARCSCTMILAITPNDSEEHPDDLFPMVGGNAPDKKLPLDLLLPTMRQLAMMDMLDPDWKMCGRWSEVMEEFEEWGESPVTKTKVDVILEERSNMWLSARNSMIAREPDMRALSSRLFSGCSERCFEYFPKCTARYCSNIETAEKPHPIRCTDCWYFHACSQACAEYANLFDQHQCSLTTSHGEVSNIRAQALKYLGLEDSRKKRRKSEKCNFCERCVKDLPGAKGQDFMRCFACKTACYCSVDCQRWDWFEGGHKNECKQK